MLGGGNPSEKENTREDVDHIQRQKSRKEQFAEKGHFGYLIIINIVAPNSLAGNKLSHIVTVEV